MDHHKLARDLVDRFEGIAPCLSADNRWVMEAVLIPWEALEKECGDGLSAPFRLLMAACLLEARYGYGDDEAARQIQESPYLQLFCGMTRFDGAQPPFDPSALQAFREALSDKRLRRIHELIRLAGGR